MNIGRIEKFKYFTIGLFVGAFGVAIAVFVVTM
jgi:hypothetical protein